MYNYKTKSGTWEMPNVLENWNYLIE